MFAEQLVNISRQLKGANASGPDIPAAHGRTCSGDTSLLGGEGGRRPRPKLGGRTSGGARARTGTGAPRRACTPVLAPGGRNAGRSPALVERRRRLLVGPGGRTRATRCLIGAAAVRQQPRRSSRQSADTGRGT